MELHKLRIDENGVWLDEILLRGVRSYKVSHPENSDIDELTLVMDTTTLRNETGSDLDRFFKQSRERSGSDSQ